MHHHICYCIIYVVCLHLELERKKPPLLPLLANAVFNRPHPFNSRSPHRNAKFHLISYLGISLLSTPLYVGLMSWCKNCSVSKNRFVWARNSWYLTYASWRKFALCQGRLSYPHLNLTRAAPRAALAHPPAARGRSPPPTPASTSRKGPAATPKTTKRQARQYI